MKKLILTLACVLLLSSCLSAQELVHKRFTTSSGGGSSSDGIYTNHIVMGQTSYGEAEDSIYTGGGGFWSGGDDWAVSIDLEINLPLQFELLQNYPNPFNPSTTISYVLSRPSQVILDVYDILGRKTATLVDDIQDTGQHTILWQADNISSGMYFYRIVAGEHIESRKMLLLK